MAVHVAGDARGGFEQFQVVDADDQRRDWSVALVTGAFDEGAQRAAEARFRCERLRPERPSAVAASNRPRSRASTGSLRLSCASRPWTKPAAGSVCSDAVVDPLPLAQAVEQPGIAQDLQMARHARLALPDGQSRDPRRSGPVSAHSASSRRRVALAGGTQPGDQVASRRVSHRT